MNVLIVLGTAALGLSALWAIQSVVLTLAGEPLAWPLRFKKRGPVAVWTGRVLIHSFWIFVLVATPLALGIRPIDALHQAFPTPVPWHSIAAAFSIMFFPAASMYALYIAAGWARFEPQHDQAKRRGKLLRRIFPGPLPVSIFEEAVFRGILLEQMLRLLPQSSAYTALAIIVNSAAFSAVHFVKPVDWKPIKQVAYGYFIVGCLFGLAYVVGGRSLWLPIAVHAAAIFVIEVARLYVVFQAPPWLVGYTEWPQSGLVGSVLVLGVAVALLTLI